MKELLDRLFESGGDQGGLTKLALPLLGLLGQDVAGLGMVTQHFTGGADLEALSGATMCFLLWQGLSSFSIASLYRFLSNLVAARKGQLLGPFTEGVNGQGAELVAFATPDVDRPSLLLPFADDQHVGYLLYLCSANSIA